LDEGLFGSGLPGEGVPGLPLIDPGDTVGLSLKRAAAYLRGKGVPTPRLDADLLLAYVLGVRREDLYMHPERPLGGGECEEFRRVLEKRGRRIPLAYITGHKEFMSLDFIVNEKVLVPRPDTEVLVETVIHRIRRMAAFFNRGREGPGAQEIAPPTLLIADIGTGSGAIAVSLAKFVPEVTVFATDISGEALEVARANARRHGVADRVILLEGDCLDPLREQGLQGKLHAIASNPPYLSRALIDLLQREIGYEPGLALFAGSEGLEFYERLLKDAPSFLKPEGFTAFEVGDEQAEEVSRMAREIGGFRCVEVIPDYSGRPRVVVAGGAGISH